MQIWPFVSKHLPEPETNPRILHLGCGNSTLAADMVLRGYSNHQLVDFSSVVIQQMQLEYPEFEWRVADVRNLEVCNDASIDVAIDKVRAENEMVRPPNDILLTNVGNNGFHVVRF